MKNIFKYYTFIFILLSDFAMFSQPGGRADEPGFEGDDPLPPVAPINGQLMVLAILGIAYAIYTFRNYKKIV
jgi:hypothetical protein